MIVIPGLNALKLDFQGEYLSDKKNKEIFEGIHDIHFEFYLNILDYVVQFFASLYTLLINLLLVIIK